MLQRVADWFIDNNVAIANLDVIETVGIRAHPCLELDRSSLAAEIRQRNQITRTALATARKRKLYPHHPVLTLHAMLVRSRTPRGPSAALAKIVTTNVANHVRR